MSRRIAIAGWLLLTVALLAAVPAEAQSLAAAVLPSSRSVQTNTTATAFATIINFGSSPAIGCRIDPPSFQGLGFAFQTTNPATNQPTGSPNAPVDIAPGAGQTFVISLTPTTLFSTTLQFTFSCANTSPAPVVSGVNTLFLAASSIRPPDVIALSATTTGDGVVTVPGATATGAFSVATVNLGATGPITVSVDTGGVSLPLTVSLCQTNPTTGACTSSTLSALSTQINAGATPTFAVFVRGLGSVVNFDPATVRVFVRFRDSTSVLSSSPGVTRGSTSVAVRMTNIPTIPDIRGNYIGSGTATLTGCRDSDDNGTGSGQGNINVTSQSSTSFSGSGSRKIKEGSVAAFTFTGTVTSSGAVSGSFTYTETIDGVFDASGSGTFSGQVSGNTLTGTLNGRDTVGDTCSFTASFQASR